MDLKIKIHLVQRLQEKRKKISKLNLFRHYLGIQESTKKKHMWTGPCGEIVQEIERGRVIAPDSLRATGRRSYA